METPASERMPLWSIALHELVGLALLALAALMATVSLVATGRILGSMGGVTLEVFGVWFLTSLVGGAGTFLVVRGLLPRPRGLTRRRRWAYAAALCLPGAAWFVVMLVQVIAWYGS